MECPHCGKNDDKVIDSRISKDNISIRRRRQCLNCSKRFTTYEATEEQLLPFLIGRKAGGEATIKNLKDMALFMSKTFAALSEDVELLVSKIDKLEKAEAAKERKKKVRERKAARRKAAYLMKAETVLRVIKRYKKGVHVSTLSTKTGINKKKLQDILFRLKQDKKIKNVERGFYLKA